MLSVDFTVAVVEEGESEVGAAVVAREQRPR
jgi:hypothetical protein